jgi:tryptophanyl-tRNA synthetase
VRRSDPGDPLKCNIYTLHEYFSSENDCAACAEGCRTAGIGCIECKKVLFENMRAVLDPIRERANALLAAPDEVWDILRAGAEHCRAIAAETMAEVRQAMGL